MSGRLSERLAAPYLRDCRPCGAVHAHEQSFRLAALRAGLELEPGTSPPVLVPVPGFAPAAAPEPRHDLVRGYLRLLGPATAKHVAGYVDAPVKDVQARWPSDAVEVEVEGERRWLLADDVAALEAGPAEGVFLLGAYDVLLQARDRDLLVADPAHAKELWPVLGPAGGAAGRRRRARDLAGAQGPAAGRRRAPVGRPARGARGRPSRSRPSGWPPPAACRSAASTCRSDSQPGTPAAGQGGGCSPFAPARPSRCRPARGRCACPARSTCPSSCSARTGGWPATPTWSSTASPQPAACGCAGTPSRSRPSACGGAPSGSSCWRARRTAAPRSGGCPSPPWRSPAWPASPPPGCRARRSCRSPRSTARGAGWKLRALGAGYDDGLAGLAREFGVVVDDDGTGGPPTTSWSRPTGGAPSTACRRSPPSRA